MKKILLIEDEEKIRKIVKTALEMEGYEVILSVNGKSGIETVRLNRPDIVLLDIMLPDISGIDVCRSLKSDREYELIPIIMLTALDDLKNIVEGLSAGANDYVAKPFDMPELLARTKSHLKMKELNDLARREEEKKSKTNLKKRKQAENALNDSEDRYKLFVQALPDIVFTISIEGHFVFINDFVDRWGYKPEEIIGKHFSEVIHPDDVESVSRFFVLQKQKGKATGDEKAPKLFDERRTGERRTKDLEIRFIRKNPKGAGKDSAATYGLVTAYGEMSSAGLYEDHQEKKLIGTVGIIRDTTGQKRAEENQAQSLEELNQKIKELERFKNITIGREKRIIELKKKVKELEKKLN